MIRTLRSNDWIMTGFPSLIMVIGLIFFFTAPANDQYHRGLGLGLILSSILTIICYKGIAIPTLKSWYQVTFGEETSDVRISRLVDEMIASNKIEDTITRRLAFDSIRAPELSMFLEDERYVVMAKAYAEGKDSGGSYKMLFLIQEMRQTFLQKHHSTVVEGLKVIESITDPAKKADSFVLFMKTVFYPIMWFHEDPGVGTFKLSLSFFLIGLNSPTLVPLLLDKARSVTENTDLPDGVAKTNSADKAYEELISALLGDLHRRTKDDNTEKAN